MTNYVETAYVPPRIFIHEMQDLKARHAREGAALQERHALEVAALQAEWDAAIAEVHAEAERLFPSG